MQSIIQPRLHSFFVVLRGDQGDAINQIDHGVLLLAYGNSAYLKAAKVLRQCLKIHSPNIPCALATDQYKQQSLKHYFDYIIPIKNKRQGYLEKIYINTYFPFKRTLYLDANSLVFKDISKIFTLLKGNPFTHLSGNIRSIDDPLIAQCKDKKSTRGLYAVLPNQTNSSF